MRHGGLSGSVGVGSVWQALSCFEKSVCVLLSTFSDTTMSSVLLLELTLPLHDAHPDFPDLLLLFFFGFCHYSKKPNSRSWADKQLLRLKSSNIYSKKTKLSRSMLKSETDDALISNVFCWRCVDVKQSPGWINLRLCRQCFQNVQTYWKEKVSWSIVWRNENNTNVVYTVCKNKIHCFRHGNSLISQQYI